MKRLALLLAASLPLVAAQACPLAQPSLQQGGVQAHWQLEGPPLAVGRQVVLRVQLCPADATLARVDATMPAHRHGMNYRPSIQALGGGQWRVQGVMLHMAGLWDLQLDVQADGRQVSLHDTITLP